MANPSEVTAELELLPWQKREALTAAVAKGRAVSNPEFARLAADYADMTHHQLVRIYLWVMAPLLVLVVGGMFWAVSRGDDEFSFGGALLAGVVTFTLFGGLMWAISLRPLVRARQANLHLAGLAEHGPRKRESSHWILAWFIAWPIAAIVGGGLQAVGLKIAGPLAFVVWVAMLWFVKRALDDRASSG